MCKQALVWATVLLLTGLIACGDSVDDREWIRHQRGEPDDMLEGGGGPYWYEVWYYEEDGRYYEFRRSAPKCGGGRDYYLYRTYYGGPPGKAAPADQDRALEEPPYIDGSPLGP